jgi:hypothetical protein
LPRLGSRVRISFPAPKYADPDEITSVDYPPGFFRFWVFPFGWVAEWLCSGLQIRVPRFDSGPSLHLLRPGGEIGRRKGLKIPRWQHRTGSIPVPGTKTNSALPTRPLDHPPVAYLLRISTNAAPTRCLYVAYCYLLRSVPYAGSRLTPWRSGMADYLQEPRETFGFFSAVNISKKAK